MQEQALRMQLAELQRSYEKAAKPIIDALVRIENTKTPAPIFIRYEQWAELQDNEVLK